MMAKEIQSTQPVTRMALVPVPTEYSNHSANRTAVEVAGPQIGEKPCFCFF